MSMDSREHTSLSVWRKAMAFAAAGLMVAGVAGAGTVSAQDASPVPAACDAPALEMGAPASPEAMPMDMATPTAAATEAPAGTAAEGETADAILAAANNVYACASAGNFEGVAALMTPNFMMGMFGTSNAADVVQGMQGTVWKDFSATNPMTYEDGRVSADVQYMSSEYQLSAERWYFAQDGDYWKIDQLGYNTANIDLDSTVVGANITETKDDAGKTTYAFELGAESRPESPALIFHFVNMGSEVHEAVLVKLPEGADPAGILDGSIQESDVEFIGVIAPLRPGEQADMTLIGVKPGVYTLVCFFPDTQGVPHAANGMIAQFEVTAAS